MKTLNKILLILLILVLTSSVDVFAQGPAPPPPPDHTETTNQDGGGRAPIGSGLLILLSLGAAYGGRKLYQIRKERLEE